MKISTWMSSAMATVLAIAAGASPARADVLEKSAKVSGVTVQYKVVLPNGYDSTKAYPGIIALGGGPQTMNTVDGVLNRNFRAEAEQRGYIVVAPAAPNGQLFFESGARIFPEFLKMILADYKIQDGKFHIAGPSNGIAVSRGGGQSRLLPVGDGLPGYVGTESRQAASDFEDVRVHTSEKPTSMWHGEMKREAELLRSKGTSPTTRSRGPAAPTRDTGRP
jgi:hypothetical protein